MSWLSDLGEKIGISKETQRAITRPIVAGVGTLIGGPALGAAAGKLVPVSKGAQPTPSYAPTWIDQVVAQSPPGSWVHTVNATPAPPANNLLTLALVGGVLYVALKD